MIYSVQNYTVIRLYSITDRAPKSCDWYTCAHMKRLKLVQLLSVSLTSHFFRGFPLLEVISFGVPVCVCVGGVCVWGGGDAHAVLHN